MPASERAALEPTRAMSRAFDLPRNVHWPVAHATVTRLRIMFFSYPYAAASSSRKGSRRSNIRITCGDDHSPFKRFKLLKAASSASTSSK